MPIFNEYQKWVFSKIYYYIAFLTFYSLYKSSIFNPGDIDGIKPPRLSKDDAERVFQEQGCKFKTNDLKKAEEK